MQKELNLDSGVWYGGRLCSNSYHFLKFPCYWIFFWICGDQYWKITEMKCFYDRLNCPEYIYAYPSLTLQGFIDIVSTPGRWIYMCEHEKSTPLHLVQSLAYHTRLITAEKAHRDMPELKSFHPDKDRDDGESKDKAGWLKNIKICAFWS